jgi:hypothetical protein
LNEFRDLKNTSGINLLVRFRSRSPPLNLAAHVVADFSIIAPGEFAPYGP